MSPVREQKHRGELGFQGQMSHPCLYLITPDSTLGQRCPMQPCVVNEV